MAATYEPIATTTLGSAAATITFSSIPATYTDLVLILVGRGDDAGVIRQANLKFNNSSSGYSSTSLAGNRSSVTSSRTTSQSSIGLLGIPGGGATSGVYGFIKTDIFSYAGTTAKTILWEASLDMGSSGNAYRSVGLWNSTAAIDRIDLTLSAGNFISGTTATLYGILKA